MVSGIRARTIFASASIAFIAAAALLPPAEISAQSSAAIPIVGDFDLDAKADPTIFTPSTGGWLTLNSSTNYTTSAAPSWGLSTDKPVPGDYDGDRKTDPAVYRASTGGWYILESSTNYAASLTILWGLSTDVPVPGDYDGDG